MAESQPMRMCAAGFLYQKQDSTTLHNRIRSCLIPCHDGDDEYDLKARAERYFSEHEEISKGIEGFSLVAWTFAVEAEAQDQTSNKESDNG